MMIHMCVDATVKAAKDCGFNCTLVDNAYATTYLEFHGKSICAENVQAPLLASLNYFYATVIDYSEVNF